MKKKTQHSSLKVPIVFALNVVFLTRLPGLVFKKSCILGSLALAISFSAISSVRGEFFANGSLRRN
jgi:hypothetical protein